LLTSRVGVQRRSAELKCRGGCRRHKDVTFEHPHLWYSAAALLAAPSCGSSAAPTAPDASTPAPARRIVVLGDSLAVSPTRSQNFPAELQSRLAATHPGWTILNAGISGDTTSGGVRRVDAALTADTAILILELGANDGLRGVPIASVETNLASMIERAQQRGVRVLLCGMETPPLNGWNYSLEFHRLFPRLAERYGVPLVPFLLAGVALNPDLNGEDEIHPNAAGARLIAATVWPYLEPLVQQTSVR
jgi:acyl-CoA thioesterase-1